MTFSPWWMNVLDWKHSAALCCKLRTISMCSGMYSVKKTFINYLRYKGSWLGNNLLFIALVNAQKMETSCVFTTGFINMMLMTLLSPLQCTRHMPYMNFVMGLTHYEVSVAKFPIPHGDLEFVLCPVPSDILFTKCCVF